MNDFSYRHVLFLANDETPVALTSFYSVTTDIAIFAPLPLRKLLAGIRRFFPNFLKLRMLEWGTPITVSSPPFVTTPGTSPTEVVRHMHAILRATARAEGQWLIIVRDFEANTESLQHEFTRLGYHLVDSLPNTYLDIAWSSAADYRAAMKSYYRSKLQKHLRRNEEQQVRHELVDDFDHLADQLCAQWMVVHNQADEFQREVLTPTFYRKFSQGMAPAPKLCSSTAPINWSATPCSCTVATSGASAERCALVTASACIRPLRMCGMEVEMLSKVRSISPASMALTTPALPL